jgi:hypothetical protein
MRYIAISIALCLVVPAVSQEQQHLNVAVATGAWPSRITARQIVRDGPYPSLIHASGAVEIRTPVCLPVGPNQSQVCDGEMVVHADQATMREDTGEIEPLGHVSIIPLRHEP